MYDGVCNLCNSTVRFIIKRDPQKHLLFCSVQSPKAEPYLRGLGLSRGDALKRFIFIQEDGWSQGSTAALEIAGCMRYPWPLLKTLLVVPLPVREAVYDFIAANRYSWFGRSQVCQVPATSVLERFLDAEDLVLGRCSEAAMAADAWKEERERHWKRWGKGRWRAAEML
ncbi:hypothetical protein COO60DRAFT_1703502 [Scenedesmus sp. NREL 46B-D3]|nr:hypothetical protein COO60DRAFT_1703502 [Scenedesmus sp. NREL 46B-D3]